MESRREGPIGLELILTAKSQDAIPGDATNYLGGVADALQANPPHSRAGGLPQASLYTNDRQIQEVMYSVQDGDDGYRVRVWLLRTCGRAI